MKRSNVKRHFDTRHDTFASKYPAGDSRKKACQELLSRVQASQQQLRLWTRQGDYNSASFAGSLAIVRNGKPFTDGEYAKTFMLDVADELFDDLPNKDKIIKRIQDMPLSARTVHDRTRGLLYSHLVEFSLKIYHMAFIEIDFLIFCFLGSLSQKGSPTPAVGFQNYILCTVIWLVMYTEVFVI